MDADKDCFTLTGEAWTLGADASAVIAMRLAQIADGGAAAQRETWRMFSEKVIAHSQFGAMIARGEFLEWADVHDNRYGTPKAPVMAALEAGKDVLFDIDWQGAKQVADNAPDDSVRVFILPPSWEDLSRRLHARAQDSEEVIQKRLLKGKDEIEHWRLYDYVIVNKNFDRAYADLGHIYRSERMKPGRNPWLPDFVEALLAE